MSEVIAGLVLAVVGVVFVVTGVLCMRRRLPRNGFVGIRLRSTMASDQAWREGHAAADPWVIAAGVGTFAGGLAQAATQWPSGTELIPLAWLLVFLVVASVRASRAAYAAVAADPLP